MSTIQPTSRGELPTGPLPKHETIEKGSHWRTKDDEFDAGKLGMWLFLGTEVLLFSGLFCGYAIMRMLYPEAFANGSHYLNWVYGGANTLILLWSSYTMASAIRHTQLGNKFWAQVNLAITWCCALAFILIKLIFEYIPKWSEGKRPGVLFDYPYAENAMEPMWWSLYYAATGIHASHVVIGMGLIGWLYIRNQRGWYGPKNYLAMENVGLYWHIVDLIWIFLFPLLYLIH